MEHLHISLNVRQKHLPRATSHPDVVSLASPAGDLASGCGAAGDSPPSGDTTSGCGVASGPPPLGRHLRPNKKVI